MAAVAWLAAASVAATLVLMLVFGIGEWRAIGLGAAGPLLAAAGSWRLVERTHRRSPAAVSALMIKLFAAKMLFFGAYAAGVVLLLPDLARTFAVALTGHYVLLHAVEANFLRRLFAGGPPAGDLPAR